MRLTGARALARLRRDIVALFLLGASVGLIVAFVLLLDSTRPERRGQRVAVTEVQRLADSRQVASATVYDYDRRVSVRLKDGRRFYAQLPSDGGAIAETVDVLAEADVPVDVFAQAGKEVRRALVQFLMPILVLVCLFALFLRVGQRDSSAGVASFSRFRGGARGAQDGISFDDVAGADEAVAELREIRDYLADPGRYAQLGARAPKGVLLVGPPGTGKTLLGRATAAEAQAAFFALSGSEFVESLVGVGAARVRDLFAAARRAAPAIVFIDELDAAGRKRGAGLGQGNDEREQTLNQLLVEMDGFDESAGIIVLAATNRPDVLDPALLRAGRFDRQITVDVPDVEGRAAILELYLGDRPLAAGVDARVIAAQCPGLSGAELANVVNEAAFLAVRAHSAELTAAMLEEGIARVLDGPQRPAVLSHEERRAVAVHEAAHVVVSRALDSGDHIAKVSIVARGRRLGTSAALLGDRDRTVLRESDLRARLLVTMAGAAGEGIAFGEHATTVHDDLHAATRLARSMVTSFGMSRLGPVTLGEQSSEVFLGASLQELSSVGPATLERIDDEVRRLVEEAEQEAAALLRDRWDDVEGLVAALLDRETVAGAELDALVAGVAPAAVRQRGAP